MSANILVLGAGRSSPALVDYLIGHAQKEDWQVTVADFSQELALSRTKNHSRSRAIAFDIKDERQRADEIKEADIVISLLPPELHFLAAVDCVRFKKNLVTASYVSEAVKKLDADANHAGVLLLNECGLDPGIDHMSVMQVIHGLKKENVKLLSFKSHTGGLIAPESNDNPWGYKFTWNPRNVVLAGQGTARFIEKGEYHYLPYNRLFEQIEKIEVDGCGTFDGYANRDSIAYLNHYDIEEIPTLLRGTLRNEGFCEAWNIFVKLGLTDDSFIVNNSGSMTYADLITAFIPPLLMGNSLKEKVAVLCNVAADGPAMSKVEWTGIFSNEKIALQNATPAQILQNLLEKRWLLRENDIDMIVMQHTFEFEKDGTKKKLSSSLVVKGDDSVMTAMAKTVGLPMGIAAKNILNGSIKFTGVQIPVMKQVYVPVLAELQKLGIAFREKQTN